jgi:hypothetical protein
LALKIKATLPAEHEGKKTLVSLLYEEAQDEDIHETQWEQWLTDQLG